MIDPTITGCLIKPLKKTPHGPKKRLAQVLMRSRTVALAKVEDVMRWVRGQLLRASDSQNWTPFMQTH